MYCTHCGTAIEEKDKFCGRCGEGSAVAGDGVSGESVISPTVPKNVYEKARMLPQRILRHGEGIVFENRPHFGFSMCHSFVLAGLIGLLGGSFLLVGLYYGILLLGLAGLVVLSRYLKWRFTIYALTTERVIRLRGIIGKDLYENRLSRIQDMRLKIGVMQRLFGCGSVLLTTAGTGSIESAWKDIGAPHDIQNQLRDLLGRSG
jgi:membrane protein YdbS with pleckstrin-like domain